MCDELEALLLNLNYKLDKVSGDIHVQIPNHYRLKNKLKLSLNFRLAATQKKSRKIDFLWKISKICVATFKVVYISPNDF